MPVGAGRGRFSGKWVYTRCMETNDENVSRSESGGDGPRLDPRLVEVFLDGLRAGMFGDSPGKGPEFRGEARALEDTGRGDGSAPEDPRLL